MYCYRKFRGGGCPGRSQAAKMKAIAPVSRIGRMPMRVFGIRNRNVR